MKLTLLGCGASPGVPRIGNDWGQCDPAEPRNRRTRCAALVEHDGFRILIDTGPDMRDQLNAANVGTVDAVIWTHDHADHTHGLDDIRQLAHNSGAPIQTYARRATRDTLASRFAYIFEGKGAYRPVAKLHELPDRLVIGGMTLTVVDQPHANITSAGLRFEYEGASIVYSTDFHELTHDMSATFAGCDIWLLDALRRQPHPAHNHLDLAVEHVSAVAPKRAVLIHMDASMDYSTLATALPAGIEPGYDGMELVP